jgi:hypothetical protein
MFDHKRALVALDGGASSEAVLRFVLEIAGPLDMRVVLVRVVEPLRPVLTPELYAAPLEDVGGRRRDAEECVGAGPRTRSSPPPSKPAART